MGLVKVKEADLDLIKETLIDLIEEGEVLDNISIEINGVMYDEFTYGLEIVHSGLRADQAVAGFDGDDGGYIKVFYTLNTIKEGHYQGIKTIDKVELY